MKNGKNKKTHDLYLEKRILVIVILVLFICVSSFLAYLQYKGKLFQNGYPVTNIVNDHEELQKEHCFEDICIKGLTIAYYKDSISSIYGTMVQKTSSKKDACVKIQFIFDNTTDTQDFETCYYDLEPNEEVFIETYFEEEQRDLVFAKDYQLTGLSADELNALYVERDHELEKMKEKES